MNEPRNKILHLIEATEDGIVVILFIAIASISLLQILLRNFFGTGLSWATPSLGILLLWLTLSGAVVATRKDRHISINVLANNLSTRVSCIIYALTKLFSSLVCSVVAYYGARLVQIDIEMGSTLFNDVPAWACELIIPISFSLLSIRFFIAALEEVRQHKRHQTS